MDPELHSDDEYTSPSAAAEQEFTHGGSMLAGSQNFVIAGGTFTNLTTNHVAASAVPSDFRMIPLGDIDLQQQLSVESGSGVQVIGRTRERRCVRRVYSATIDGRGSNVTVAMYEGNRAEEDWLEDVEIYLALRHPNIVQLCGGASHSNIYATVFHGDLVPFMQYMAPYSPIMTVYMFAGFAHDNDCALEYLLQTPKLRSWIGDSDYQTWIRRSTSRLCLDLVPPSPEFKEPGFHLWSCGNEPIASAVASLRILQSDAEAVESLTIEDYHTICSWSLALDRGKSDIPPSETVSVGGVVHMDHTDAAIAFLRDAHAMCFGWWCPQGKLIMTEDGWARYEPANGFNPQQTRLLNTARPSGRSAWLSQAHHIFTSHQITAHLEDYVFVDGAEFILLISGPNTTPPPGYLFLCPSEAFAVAPATYKWPDCPAYWSLDPSGVDRLSTEEATRLGFPSMELQTRISKNSWDASVYAGLRQFHKAKGFDPASQEVARHMGYSLYRVSGATEDPSV
ncbi:hypothetical protein C8R46DRAFT_1092863, partial [Mycena filopes]